MKRILLLAAAALASLAGCTHAQEIDRSANHELLAAHVQAEADIRHVACPDGAPIGPTCGMLTTRIAKPEFRERFRVMRCGGLSDAACKASFDAAIGGWLAERYWAASFPGVARVCEANPSQCGSPEAYERELLVSHNAGVTILESNRQADVDEARDHAHRLDRARAASEVNAAALFTAAFAELTLAAATSPRP